MLDQSRHHASGHQFSHTTDERRGFVDRRFYFLAGDDKREAVLVRVACFTQMVEHLDPFGLKRPFLDIVGLKESRDACMAFFSVSIKEQNGPGGMENGQIRAQQGRAKSFGLRILAGFLEPLFRGRQALQGFSPGRNGPPDQTLL